MVEAEDKCKGEDIQKDTEEFPNNRRGVAWEEGIAHIIRGCEAHNRDSIKV